MLLGSEYSVQIKMYTSDAWVGYTKHAHTYGEAVETLNEYYEIAKQLIKVGAIKDYSISANLNVKKEV